MTAQTEPGIGTRYPLLFSYRDTLFGNGFLVEVQVTNGRALCVREEDAYWVYGVNPGGMAAHGEDADAAHGAFRHAFSEILVDLAQGAASFDDFRTAVQAFFEDTNPGYEAEWTAAVAGVRRGDVTLDGIPLVSADSPRSIVASIKQVETVTPQDNSGNVRYLLAA